MSHQILSRRAFAGLLVVSPLAAADKGSGWTDLFDGRTMNGWNPSEHKSSWKVADGMLTANGPRSHLFYNGPVHGADFRNFELEVELITQPECNSGVYFHTAYQETGFPEKGFEVQVNNTARGDGGYLERKKTASLYGIRNMYKQLVPDEKPFRMRVAVRGKNVQIHLNDQLVVDYVEPTPPVIPAGGEKMRYLDHGTFALQCHNDGSRAAFRSVRVRPLPDNLPSYTGRPLVADDVYRAIINIGRHNLPMVDYHVSLRPGLNLADVLRKSRADGLQYGLVASSASLENETAVRNWLEPLAGRPVFYGLHGADRIWTRKLTRTTAQQFDYVLADNHAWIKSSTSTTNQDTFADALLTQMLERLNTEPIDLFSCPTYLPAGMKAASDQVWTEARRTKLIDALVKNQVALELNSHEQLPSRRFIEMAKQAGCKFGFGTGNESAADLKRCEYGLQMVETCKLDWQNFWTPGGWYPKAADRRWPA